MSRELAEAWLSSALADLRNIEHIIDDNFLTHIVAFHAQQCVEKCFKAILVMTSGTAPRIHSTLTLYGLVKNELSFRVDVDMLTDFDEIYIDARYPGDMGLLPDGKPSQDDAREFFNVARKIFDVSSEKINRGLEP